MADTLDLLTLAEGYRAINDRAAADAGTGNQDTVVARMITAISRRVDARCGPVVNREVSNEQHPGGGEFVVPKKLPVSSVTTIKEYSGTSATTLAAEDLAAGTTSADDYWLDPDTSIIYRRASGYDRCFAATRVIVTYVAGRAADTASVDARFKEAAAGCLRRLWKRESGAWAQGPRFYETLDPETGAATAEGFYRAVDPVINELLGDELLVPGLA